MFYICCRIGREFQVIGFGAKCSSRLWLWLLSLLLLLWLLLLCISAKRQLACVPNMSVPSALQSQLTEKSQHSRSFSISSRGAVSMSKSRLPIVKKKTHTTFYTENLNWNYPLKVQPKFTAASQNQFNFHIRNGSVLYTYIFFEKYRFLFIFFF